MKKMMLFILLISGAANAEKYPYDTLNVNLGINIDLGFDAQDVEACVVYNYTQQWQYEYGSYMFSPISEWRENEHGTDEMCSPISRVGDSTSRTWSGVINNTHTDLNSEWFAETRLLAKDYVIRFTIHSLDGKQQQLQSGTIFPSVNSSGYAVHSPKLNGNLYFKQNKSVLLKVSQEEFLR